MVHSCVTLGIVLLALSSAGSIYAHEEPENHYIGARRNTLMNIQHAVEITVMNREGVLLSDAKVTVQPAGNAAPVPVGYDAARQIYYADIAHISHVIIEVSHAEYEGERRVVRIQSGHQQSLFVLGKKGDAFAYVGQGKMPYTPRPEVVGFVIDLGGSNGLLSPAELKQKIADHIDLPADSIELFHSGGLDQRISQGIVHVSRTGSGEIDMKARKELIGKLRRSSFIQQAGPVYNMDDRLRMQGSISFKLLTNILMVQFKPGVSEQEIQDILDEIGAQTRMFYSSSDTYVVTLDDSTDEDINATVEKLLNSGRVYETVMELGGLIELDGDFR